MCNLSVLGFKERQHNPLLWLQATLQCVLIYALPCATLACPPTRRAYQRHYAKWCNHMIMLPACYTNTQTTRSFCERKIECCQNNTWVWVISIPCGLARMQLMQYLATNLMPLIVTNITQNFITQKFVLPMNTALSAVTDILKVLSNRVLQHQCNV